MLMHSRITQTVVAAMLTTTIKEQLK